jgi:2-polyprenyl-3-methyl-5-hydroxy-6-metoxy-1,4-benzoquinol methylase
MADQIVGVLSPWLRNARLSRARPYLHGTVLDYGCGVGALSDFCDPESYLGVDIDRESVAVAQARRPQFRFVRETPSTPQQFDTIVALAVIEHLEDPAALLAEFGRLLAPGGQIVLTTPHPSLEWAHTLGAKVGLFSPEASEEHEELIDLKRMRELAAAAGLVVQRYERFLLRANQLFVLGHDESAVETEVPTLRPTSGSAGVH